MPPKPSDMTRERLRDILASDPLDSRTQWARTNSRLYAWARYHAPDVLDERFPRLNRTKWTRERIIELVRVHQLTRRSHLALLYPSAYKVALYLFPGLLDQLFVPAAIRLSRPEDYDPAPAPPAGPSAPSEPQPDWV